MEDCIAALEKFIHGGPQGEHALPVLVRTALAHVQFETIHPFLDGNGRLGRLRGRWRALWLPAAVSVSVWAECAWREALRSLR